MTRGFRRSTVAAIAVLLLAGPAAVNLFTDWLWFGETGYQTTFLKILTSRAAIGVAGMALAFGVLFASNRLKQVAASGALMRQQEAQVREDQNADQHPDRVTAGHAV